jgi:carboxypeptidase Taq
MERTKRVIILQSAMSIVDWDMETKMPPKGINMRSEQLALLKGIEHRLSTDTEIGDLLAKIEKNPDFDTLAASQKRNILLIKKQYDEQTRLPEDLVKETARQRILTINKWKKAKAAKDFSMLKSDLEKLIELKLQAAEILKDVKETETIYDALIDIYEPRMSSRRISTIFNDLKNGLVKIIEKCQSSNLQPEPLILKKIPISLQRKISSQLAEFLEYEIDSESAGGRIDETEHPFTSGYYDDVRVTTHYYEENFFSSIFSVLHECGHAIYEQNLNQDWIYQPIGASCSLGFHESQSRFIENIIGRSREFWSYMLPKTKKLDSILYDLNTDDFFFTVNTVEPSKIRIEADEVTYSLHVIIRFEIERDLMENKITTSDLPEMWNHKYNEYLGVTIKNDAEGVMQDTHWPSGLQGYFPTYALGNIYSGQILGQLSSDLPDWKNHISNGEFHTVKEWLTKNVYSFGNLYDPSILIRKITDEEINVNYYLEYLYDKYSKLYGF